MATSLTKKGTLIDFTGTREATDDEVAARLQTAKTPAGLNAQNALMASRVKELSDDLKLREAQIAELNAELAKAYPSGPRPMLLDPQQVVPSRYANRDETSFRRVEFEELKAEIESAKTNVQPIKVRPIEGKEGQYEIVFGHRRHRACLELGLKVYALVEQLDDRKLFEEMDRENRQRANLCPVEQGRIYARAIDEGLYPSEPEMYKALGVHRANFDKALDLGRLKDEIVGAFPGIHSIQLRWGSKLRKLQEKPEVLKEARKIAALKKRLSPAEVFARLAEVGEPSAIRSSELQRPVVKQASDGSVTLKFAPGLVSADRLAQLQELVDKFLSERDARV